LESNQGLKIESYCSVTGSHSVSKVIYNCICIKYSQEGIFSQVIKWTDILVLKYW